MFRTFFAVATAISLSMASSLALAGMGERFSYSNGKNFHEKRVYWVDRKQDITVDFRMKADGSSHFHSRYSNGKRFDGDHFYSKVVLLNKGGSPIATFIAGVGLNGSGGGGTQVAYRDLPASLPKEYVSQVATIIFEAGHSDSVNDKEWWKNAAKNAQKVLGLPSAGAILHKAGMPKHLSPLIIQ